MPPESPEKTFKIEDSENQQNLQNVVDQSESSNSNESEQELESIVKKDVTLQDIMDFLKKNGFNNKTDKETIEKNYTQLVEYKNYIKEIDKSIEEVEKLKETFYSKVENKEIKNEGNIDSIKKQLSKVEEQLAELNSLKREKEDGIKGIVNNFVSNSETDVNIENLNKEELINFENKYQNVKNTLLDTVNNNNLSVREDQVENVKNAESKQEQEVDQFLNGVESTDSTNEELRGAESNESVSGELQDTKSPENANSKLQGVGSTQEVNEFLNGVESSDNISGELQGAESPKTVSGELQDTKSPENVNSKLQGTESNEGVSGELQGVESSESVNQFLNGSESTDSISGELQGTESTQEVNEFLNGIESPENASGELQGAESLESVNQFLNGVESPENVSDELQGAESTQEVNEFLNGIESPENASGELQIAKSEESSKSESLKSVASEEENLKNENAAYSMAKPPENENSPMGDLKNSEEFEDKESPKVDEKEGGVLTKITDLFEKMNNNLNKNFEKLNESISGLQSEKKNESDEPVKEKRVDGDQSYQDNPKNTFNNYIKEYRQSLRNNLPMPSLMGIEKKLKANNIGSYV